MSETIGPSPADMNARPKKETPTENDGISPVSASDLKDSYERASGPTMNPVALGPESEQEQQAIEQKREELEAAFQAASVSSSNPTSLRITVRSPAASVSGD